MNELTAKQARFVNEYIRTLNVTQSAIKAGYSENSACDMMWVIKETTHQAIYTRTKDKIIDENVLTAKSYYMC